jgi:hypothetical protein
MDRAGWREDMKTNMRQLDVAPDETARRMVRCKINGSQTVGRILKDAYQLHGRDRLTRKAVKRYLR